MIRLARRQLSLFMVISLGILNSPIHAAMGVGSEPTEHVIEIVGFKFIPENVTIKAGDTVTWVNKDIAPHTATADNLSFSTGELKLNESESIVFDSDQTLTYFCKFHPNMKAKLTVE